MYTLYNYQPSGNCYKIRLLLAQLNIPFETIHIDILNKESRTVAFLEKNLNGRIPVLQHREKYLPESNAALWYLARGSKYLPEDEFEQAQVLQWMFFEQYSHEPNIGTIRFWVAILDKPEQFKAQIEQKKSLGYDALDVMENHLMHHEFFVGESYSIADIALYAYTHVAHEGGFDLTNYYNVNRWLKLVESQIGYICLDDS